MTFSRILTGGVLVSALAVFDSACTTVPTRSVVVEPVRAYAVVVTDDHGVLSAADSQKVRIGVIQYLTDEGFLQSSDRYTDDLLRADVVFRVRIAWQGAVGGFTVTEVQPSYSGPPGSAASAGGGPTRSVPWDYDPWDYGPTFDPYFGAYDPFLGLYPLLGIYAWYDVHPPRVIKRAHNRDDHRAHRPHPPEGYSRYWPRPGDSDDHRPRAPGAWPSRSDGHGADRADPRARWGVHDSFSGSRPPDAHDYGNQGRRRGALPGASLAAGATRPLPSPHRFYTAPSAPHSSAPAPASHGATSASFAPAPSSSAPAFSSSSSSSSASSSSRGRSNATTAAR